jgi:hypothetical protein
MTFSNRHVYRLNSGREIRGAGLEIRGAGAFRGGTGQTPAANQRSGFSEAWQRVGVRKGSVISFQWSVGAGGRKIFRSYERRAGRAVPRAPNLRRRAVATPRRRVRLVMRGSRGADPCQRCGRSQLAAAILSMWIVPVRSSRVPVIFTFSPAKGLAFASSSSL